MSFFEFKINKDAPKPKPVKLSFKSEEIKEIPMRAYPMKVHWNPSSIPLFKKEQTVENCDYPQFGEVRCFKDPSEAGPGWVVMKVIKGTAVVRSDSVVTERYVAPIAEVPYEKQPLQFFKIKTVTFLMGKLTDRAWEDLTKKNAELKDQNKKLNFDNVSFRDKIERLGDKLKKANDSSKEAIAYRDEALKRLNKLEVDLAKARTEIGERRWREMFEPTEQKGTEE